MIDTEEALGDAVRHFWNTRAGQRSRQGRSTGTKDAGSRADVTGGKHADGFVRLIASVVSDAELPDAEIMIHTTNKRRLTLPGHFRPGKEWDVVVLSGRNLVAVVEVKSQVGSFGNNYNNRIEEALGSATDFWTAYRKGLFEPSIKPWLGYMFMLEEHLTSLRPTKTINLSPHPIDASFQGLSYAKRYELACERMVRESLYDAACFFTRAWTHKREAIA